LAIWLATYSVDLRIHVLLHLDVSNDRLHRYVRL
jgi:hypothetical protein